LGGIGIVMNRLTDQERAVKKRWWAIWEQGDAVQKTAVTASRLSGDSSGSHKHDRCGSCRHRDLDRSTLEAFVPGLASFGSGFGASVSDSRLCTYHDRLTSHGDSCGAFAARTL
jgi:hypothetical protein